MTQFLPPNLLALFAPRNPIPYFPPLDVLPWEKKEWPYSGIAQYVGLFESASETPPATRAETKDERTARKQQERKERGSATLKEQIEKWDVQSDPNVEGDPFKTLFIGRINFDTSESKLKREFEQFGRIKRIKLIMNIQTDKPRGYAFIEYEKERDMHTAYKNADGKKIDGKRVVVDVERGRTVKSWRPRRLGGGLGGTRRGGPNENIKYSGRIDERDLGEDRRGRDDGAGRDGGGGREGGAGRDGGGGRDERRRSRSTERRRRSRSKERPRRDRSRSRDKRDSERRTRDRSDRDRSDRDRSDRDKDRSSRRDKDRDRDRDKERSKDRHSRSDRSDRKRERDDVADNGREDKRIKTEPSSNSNGSEGSSVKTEH